MNAAASALNWTQQNFWWRHLGPKSGSFHTFCTWSLPWFAVSTLWGIIRVAVLAFSVFAFSALARLPLTGYTSCPNLSGRWVELMVLPHYIEQNLALTRFCGNWTRYSACVFTGPEHSGEGCDHSWDLKKDCKIHCILYTSMGVWASVWMHQESLCCPLVFFFVDPLPRGLYHV